MTCLWSDFLLDVAARLDLAADVLAVVVSRGDVAHQKGVLLEIEPFVQQDVDG